MNRFLKTHPLSMLVYFMAVIGVVIVCDNPVLRIISLTGGIAYGVYLSKGREFISELVFYVILFLLITVTNPIFVHNGKTPLFFMNSNPVTLEALLCGASIALLIISAMLWFGCMTKVMTSDKFYFLFSKISPRLALVFSMTLSFIPRLKKSYKDTDNAHKTLGIYSKDSRFDRLKLKLDTMSSVVSQSAENSIETSMSMNSRGYGNKKRTNSEILKFKGYDLFVLLFSVLVLSFEIFTLVNKNTAFEYYPTITIIEFDLISLLAYAGYMILCMMPVIIEITENVKWKYYLSKI